MAAQQIQQEGQSNVLVSMDNSTISENAFKWYLTYFWRPSHKIHVCTVPEYWGNVQRLISPGRLEELIAETSNATAKLKENIDKICKDCNVDASFEVLKGEDPWHQICKHAEHIKADVIVLGTRGMGMVKRTILGSQSEAVLHHSHCPVLIYKGK